MKQEFLINNKKAVGKQKYMYNPMYRLWISKHYFNIIVSVVIIILYLIIYPFVYLSRLLENLSEINQEKVSQWKKPT